MVDDVLLKGVAHLVDEVYVHIGVAGIHLAPAFVDGHEHGFYAACGLRHQACGACRGNGEAGYVAPSVVCHVGIKLRVGFLDAEDEGVVLLALGVENLEGSALACHVC